MQKILPVIGIIATIAIIITAGFLIRNFLEANPPEENKNPPLESSQSPAPEGEGTDNVPAGDQFIIEKPLTEKSIAMIIAFKDFRDEEYFVPKQIFLAAGVKTVLTASTKPGTAIGADGGEAQVNLLVKDINVADFDGVVFVGGPGALQYLDNEDSYRVAREAVSQGKLLSAICVAPTILAKAGVLEGKNATVWTSAMDKSAVQILEQNGAIFQDKAVVRDGKIITGNGPEAADPFAMEIIDYFMQ